MIYKKGKGCSYIQKKLVFKQASFYQFINEPTFAPAFFARYILKFTSEKMHILKISNSFKVKKRKNYKKIYFLFSLIFENTYLRIVTFLPKALKFMKNLPIVYL